MPNDLIPYQSDEFQKKFPVLAGNGTELMRANLGGETVGPGDLDRIKVPSGGGTNWQIPTLDGDKSEKSLEGIIIYTTRRRAYWSDPNPTGTEPDCSSADCLHGVGNPGGDCLACALNEFGSAVKGNGEAGRGKACKESRLLFLLRPGTLMPLIVAVPPGSLKSMRQYLLKLTEAGAVVFGTVTRLELTKTNNKDGIAFAQMKATMVGRLDQEATASVMEYAKSFHRAFVEAEVERTDVEGQAA